jgi:hypothetical protein
MQDNDEVPLEDMIAVEQVAQELWRKATKGSAGIVRARQAGVEEPRTHGGHHLAQTSRSAVSRNQALAHATRRRPLFPLTSASADLRAPSCGCPTLAAAA